MSIKEKVRETWFSYNNVKRAGVLLGGLCVLALLLLAMLAGARGVLSRWSFSRDESTLIQEKERAEKRAKEAEENYQAALEVLQEKDAELKTIASRAELAEKTLDTMRNITVRTKVSYEEVRNRPLDLSKPAPSVADVCTKLAELGIVCTEVR